MAKKLTSLTDEQKAQFGPYAQMWIERALDCTPVDRASVEDGMRRCYEYAGIPWHGNVVWVDSPIVVAFAGPIAGHVLDQQRARCGDAVDGAVHDAVGVAVRGAVRGAVDGAVGGAVGGAVHDAVHDAVRDAVDGAVDVVVGVAVGGAVHDAVHDAVGDAVDGAVDVVVDDAVAGAVHDAVRDAVGVAVDGAVDDAVAGAVGGAVGGAVDDAVGVAVRGAVHGAVGGAVGGNWHRYLGGQWWASWSAWRACFRDIVGLSLPGDMWQRQSAYDDASQAGWWWPHKDFVIVAERPAVIHRERVPGQTDGWGSHRLHNTTGPSIAFSDGWALWHWHGLQVPQWVIEDPDPVAKIRTETNTEIRRAAIERYGWDRWLDVIGTQPVSVQADPGNPGHDLRLYDLPRDAQLYATPVRLLVMENASRDRDGTRRRFAESVPVDVPDAIAAAAWQFDVAPEVYRQLVRAT